MRFKDRRVLLTGGSGAMGRLIARDIRKAGGQLTIVDLNPPEDGGAFIAGDLSTAAGLDALCARVAAEPWDILINLAGIQHFGPLEAQTPAHLNATYMVNLVAPARLAQSVLPGMKARGRGQIANVGSIFGSINFAHFATYSSSKAGLRALSQALRRELIETGVGVTYVAPRAVRTPLNSDAVNAWARLTRMTMDEPEAVARRIVRAIRDDRKDVYLGFPEALFVRLNGFAPGLIDGALRALSQALRRELIETGVGVTYVAPRAVRTPLNSDAVNAWAKLTGMTMDEPGAIARRIVRAIRDDRKDVYLGFPEALFVRLNGFAPGLIDGALRANDLKARALFTPSQSH